MRSARLFQILAALVAGAAPATAQFVQYTAPGSLSLSPLPVREVVEQAMEEAPWQLGPIRLAPWLALRDVTYYDSVGSEGESDLSATVAGGVHAYLPLGSRVILAGYALPEYVWWEKQANRNLWNGRYGAGAFAYLRRFSLEARSTRGRTQQLVSTELTQPLNVRQDTDRLRAEYKFLERFSVFGEAERDQARYRSEDLELPSGGSPTDLDNTTRRYGVGLRYIHRSWLSVGIGTETIRTDFDNRNADRSSSGDAAFLELGLEGHRLSLLGRLARVSLDPEAGSSFTPYQDVVGRAGLTWKPGSRLEWQLYAGRSLSYSFLTDRPYFVDERAGVALSGAVGHRLSYRLFWESGANDYPRSGNTAGGRNNLEAYGAQFNTGVGRRGTVLLGAEHTTFASPTPAGRRNVTRLLASVRFGSRGGQWW